MEQNPNRSRGLFQVDEGEIRSLVRYFKAKEVGVYIKNCLNFIQAAPKAGRATSEPNPAVVSRTSLLCSSCASGTSRIHGKSLPWDVPVSRMEKWESHPFKRLAVARGVGIPVPSPRLDPGGAGGRWAISKGAADPGIPVKPSTTGSREAAAARLQSSNTGSGFEGNKQVGYEGGESPETGII